MGPYENVCDKRRVPGFAGRRAGEGLMVVRTGTGAGAGADGFPRRAARPEDFGEGAGQRGGRRADAPAGFAAVSSAAARAKSAAHAKAAVPSNPAVRANPYAGAQPIRTGALSARGLSAAVRRLSARGHAGARSVGAARAPRVGAAAGNLRANAAPTAPQAREAPRGAQAQGASGDACLRANSAPPAPHSREALSTSRAHGGSGFSRGYGAAYPSQGTYAADSLSQRSGAPHARSSRPRGVPARQLRFSRKPSPRVRAVAVVACCVAVFGAIMLVVLNANARTGLPGGVAVFGEVAPESTPQSAWRQGQMPFLYQTDRQWASEPYAGSTVGEAGCGPTCLSMVYVFLTGRTDLDPAAMCRFSEQHGYVSDGMTAWAFMTDGAAELGLNASEVPADAESVTAELAAGRPVIASVRPGDFTTTGHFIVLAGLDESGRLVVHDPNSAKRSGETWDMDRVLDQCAGLWSFSA